MTWHVLAGTASAQLRSGSLLTAHYDITEPSCVASSGCLPQTGMVCPIPADDRHYPSMFSRMGLRPLSKLTTSSSGSSNSCEQLSWKDPVAKTNKPEIQRLTSSCVLVPRDAMRRSPSEHAKKHALMSTDLDAVAQVPCLGVIDIRNVERSGCSTQPSEPIALRTVVLESATDMSYTYR